MINIVSFPVTVFCGKCQEESFVTEVELSAIVKLDKIPFELEFVNEYCEDKPEGWQSHNDMYRRRHYSSPFFVEEGLYCPKCVTDIENER